MKIYQLAAGFRPGDAISNHVLTIQSCFEKFGWKSDIYVDLDHNHFDQKEFEIHDFRSLQACEEDVVIYHYSIGSEITNFFKGLKGRKILWYHNITPAHFFIKYSAEKCFQLRKGREELNDLMKRCDEYIADSSYNAEELMSIGVASVQVFPLIYNYSYLDQSASRMVQRVFPSKGKNVIFVGRMAPNKKIEDILTTVALFKNTIDENIKIRLIGMHSGMESYMDYLWNLADQYGFDRNVFTGYVDEQTLIGYYQSADLFLSMSEHEGFCVPLVEAMKMKVPVMAYDAGAVSETLNGAGLVFNRKDPEYVVECMIEILDNKVMKDKMIQKGLERYQSLTVAQLEPKLYEVCSSIIGSK